MSDTATSDDPAPYAGPDRRRIRAFHLVVVAVAGAMCWSVSYPGIHFLLFAASLCASVLVGFFWLGWISFVAIITGRWRNWFLIGPLIGVLTFVLLRTGAPFEMRWAASRGAFAATLAGHPIPPPGSGWEPFTVPRRLGLYNITSARWVPGGAVFDEAHLSFNDTGFAYLPDGPTAELEHSLFENPQFRHLGGGWYSWTASW